MGQELIARETLKKMVVQIISEKPTDVKQITTEYVSRAEDEQLQKRISEEKIKALESSMILYGFQDRLHGVAENRLYCVYSNTCIRH